jgi:hypothetical protein
MQNNKKDYRVLMDSGATDLISGKKIWNLCFFISQEQFDVLAYFADHKKDGHLNPTFKINDCEFKVEPNTSFVDYLMKNKD